MSTAVLLVVRAYANFEATCDARALALELVHGGVWGVSFSRPGPQEPRGIHALTNTQLEASSLRSDTSVCKHVCVNRFIVGGLADGSFTRLFRLIIVGLFSFDCLTGSFDRSFV